MPPRHRPPSTVQLRARVKVLTGVVSVQLSTTDPSDAVRPPGGVLGVLARMTDQQQRLFRLAVDVLHVAARHTPAGWSLSISTRRGDETWLEAPTTHYCGLGTDELYDTIAAELAHRLGL